MKILYKLFVITLFWIICGIIFSGCEKNDNSTNLPNNTHTSKELILGDKAELESDTSKISTKQYSEQNSEEKSMEQNTQNTTDAVYESVLSENEPNNDKNIKIIHGSDNNTYKLDHKNNSITVFDSNGYVVDVMFLTEDNEENAVFTDTKGNEFVLSRNENSELTIKDSLNYYVILETK